METISNDYSEGSNADREDGHSSNLRKQKSVEKSKVDKRKEQDKRKLEPSLKWKALEVDDRGKKGDKHIRIKTPKKGNRERFVDFFRSIFSRISKRFLLKIGMSFAHTRLMQR